jgi:O-antigen ligase
MSRKLSRLVAPAYLLLCLIFGGSVQSAWGNFALQLIGLAILVWVIARRRSLGQSASFPYILILLALAVICLQLIPLPPGIWTKLPGRTGIADGYELLRMPLPWLPVSETPYQSATTVFVLLPPIAMFAAMQVSDSDRAVAGALVTAAALAIALGALQVASGSGSGWYFYSITNSGAVGFFANSNHMGTLLLATIPFVAALLLSGKSQRQLRGRTAALAAIAAAGLGLILIGITLNRSLAALLLVIPILLATGLMVPAGWRMRWFGAPVAVLALAVAVGVLSVNPLSSTAASQAKEVSIQSRQAIWHTTAHAIRDSFPAGTGLGSFAAVYPLYENAGAVDSTYVNHAHNDYLELTLELGAAGILLLALFLGWWALRSVRIWSSNLSSPFTRAATIASAAILAHSVVDYPLRTSAMAAVFAMCIGIIARFNRKETASAQTDSSGLRHVTIGR